MARTQSASESAGSELSSSCPPGSVVSGAPDGSTPGEELVGSPGEAANPDMASVIRSADTPMAGLRASRTSHSISMPTRRGGPVFRQMP